METIVVGFDGSEPSQRVLTRAAELARALSARLVVASVQPAERETVPEPPPAPVGPGPAHVSPVVPGPPPLPGGGLSPPPPVPLTEAEIEPKELARKHLEEARRRLGGDDHEVEYVAEVGEPDERLLALVEERGAGLLVVGAGEHGLLDRLFGGGVAGRVARAAPCDVLLVR